MQQGAAQVKQFATNVQSNLAGVSGSNQKVGGSFDTLKGKISNFVTDSLGKLARFTGYFLAVQAVTRILGGMISEFRNLDEQMRNIQSITLESDAAMKETTKSLLGMVLSGNSAGQSASALAEALYEVDSAGYRGAEALKIVELSAKGAAAGLTETKQTTKLLTTILQAYKIPVSEAANMMDHLFTIVDLGVLHFDDLVTTMGYVVPFAAELKIPLQEVGAAIELLTRQGQQPSRVMTGLANVMSELLSPNEALTAAMDALGFSTGRAMIAELGFVGTIQKLSEYANDSSVSIDAAAKAQDKLGESVSKSSQKQKNAHDSLKIAQDSLNIAQAKASKSNTPESRLAVQRAQLALNKATQAAAAADADASKAAKAFADSTSGVGDSAEDAGSKLAKMFPDIRGLRDILPLATNNGQDFVDMMGLHNEEMDRGERMLKALAQQQKSFNYQVRALTANLLAFGAILFGPVFAALAGLIKPINDLFKKLADFDEETGKVTFIWEKIPAILHWSKVAFAGIATVLGMVLLPIIYTLVAWLGSILAGIGAFALLNPFTVIIVGAIMLLQHFGKLDDAWRLFKRVAASVFGFVKKSIEDFIHFFKLGFEGGIAGGISGFERFAMRVGALAKSTIKTIKDIVQTVEELAHLFLVGLEGGKIGGAFTDLEKAAFNAGRVVRELWPDFKAGLEMIGRTAVTVFSVVGPIILKVAVAVGRFIGELSKHKAFWIALGIAIATVMPYFVLIPAAIFLIIAAIGALKRHWEEIKNIWASLPNSVHIALMAALGHLKAFFDQGKNLAMVGMNFIINMIRGQLQVLKGVFNIFAGLFHGDWGRMWQGIKQVVSGIWMQIKAVLQAEFGVLKAMFGGIWASIKVELGVIWAAMGAEAREKINGIVDLLKEVPAKIGEAATSIYTKAKEVGSTIISSLIDGIKSAVTTGSEIATAIGDAVVDAFRSAFQWAHDHIKVTIGGLKIAGREIIPHVEWSFPAPTFAKGVRDFLGGMAMLGENGPEMAFLPPGSSVATAPKTSQIMDNLARPGRGGGGGANVSAEFNVSAPTIDEIAKQLHKKVDELDRQMRFRAVRGGSALNGRLM